MKTRIGKLVNKILTFLVGDAVIIQIQPRDGNGRFKKR